jgi:hypothetical protein
LDFLEFLANVSEALAKFHGFDSYHYFAVLTANMGFGAGLHVADQNGILLTAVRADDIDGFILEHQRVSDAYLVSGP